jgi:prepilin-type N-terminal cleavage/methylation domain-containing protein
VYRFLKEKEEGFSLVEMLIAVAISSIVLVSLIALLGYSVRSANRTQARASLQNEAKDAMNHITGYIMEGSHVLWDSGEKKLIIQKDETVSVTPAPTGDGTTKNVRKRKAKYYYYFNADEKKMYFREAVNGSTDATDADDKYLLAEKVTDFTAEPDAENERIIHVEIKFEDSESNEIVCKQDVHIRNACKGGCL